MCEGGVGGVGDAAGGVVAGEVDAGVGGGVALQGGDDLGVGGAVVDEAELPVGVGLVADGGDGLLEHVQGWVVDGGEDGDERPSRGRGVARVGVRSGGAGSGGRVGVDERRLHPHRTRHVSGLQSLDAEVSATVDRRDLTVDPVPPRPATVSGGQRALPQLGGASRGVRGGHAARTVPAGRASHEGAASLAPRTSRRRQRQRKRHRRVGRHQRARLKTPSGRTGHRIPADPSSSLGRSAESGNVRAAATSACGPPASSRWSSIACSSRQRA